MQSKLHTEKFVQLKMDLRIVFETARKVLLFLYSRILAVLLLTVALWKKVLMLDYNQVALRKEVIILVGSRHPKTLAHHNCTGCHVTRGPNGRWVGR